jgi:hypothetical protein
VHTHLCGLAPVLADVGQLLVPKTAGFVGFAGFGAS